MAKTKVIPRIDVPIMEPNGSMTLAWYLFLEYLSNKGGGSPAPASSARITITQDGVECGSFTLDQEEDQTIDVSGGGGEAPVTSVNGMTGDVELGSADVGALPDTTKYGYTISASIDTSTYVMTLTLKDQDGNTMGVPQEIDLPLETMVVSGRYDAATKKVILVLKNGNTIEFSVADLVSGLQPEITSQNKLSADLVDDTQATHKFVSASEKTTWSAKQDAISDLSTIRSNATAGAGAAQTIATYGNIVTHNAAEFQAALTTAQLAAVNSTITAEKVSIYDGYAAQIAAKQDTISDLATIRTGAALGATALQPNASITGGTYAKITFDSHGLVLSGANLSAADIPDLSATYYPTTNPNHYTSNIGTVTSVNSVTPDAQGNITISIPTQVTETTVAGWGFTKNTGTITGIKMNGTTVGTTGLVDLGNIVTDLSGYATESWVTSQGYLTSITGTMVTNALGYTPYNSTNPSGYQANVIETVKVNGAALPVTSKAVNVSVPTKTSDITNDSGFITGITGMMVTTALGYTPVAPSQITGFETSAHAAATYQVKGNYAPVTDIPTVNNPTITFKQGSTVVGTITLNQSTNQTITFAAGGGGSFTPDGTTITTNAGGEAQTIAVKNQNTAAGALAQIKLWEGTKDEFEDQYGDGDIDDDTLCIIKGVADSFDWGSVASSTITSAEDYGYVTDTASVGTDWGHVTEPIDTTKRMTLRIGEYTLGTWGEIN